MNTEEIKAKIALLRGQGNQTDLAGVLADVLEALVDMEPPTPPTPAGNDPRIVGDVSEEYPVTIGTGVSFGSQVNISRGVRVYDNVEIGTGVVVGGDFSLEDAENNTAIGTDVLIGIINEVPGMCGGNTYIGTKVTIGTALRDGDNVSIENNVKIGQGVDICIVGRETLAAKSPYSNNYEALATFIDEGGTGSALRFSLVGTSLKVYKNNDLQGTINLQ